MKTATKQATFLIPEHILDDLKKHVTRRERSRFVAEALKKELSRLHLAQVLEDSFGAWRDEDHPEFIESTGKFISGTRKSARFSASTRAT